MSTECPHNPSQDRIIPCGQPLPRHISFQITRAKMFEILKNANLISLIWDTRTSSQDPWHDPVVHQCEIFLQKKEPKNPNRPKPNCSNCEPHQIESQGSLKTKKSSLVNRIAGRCYHPAKTWGSATTPELCWTECLFQHLLAVVFEECITAGAHVVANQNHNHSKMYIPLRFFHFKNDKEHQSHASYGEKIKIK